VATLLFVAAVLSKPTAIVLPIIVLIVAWARGVELRRAIMRMIPWFGVSLTIAIITHELQGNPPFVNSPEWLRPIVALHALAFYLGKIIAPLNLAVDYGLSPDWLRLHPAAWLLASIPIALAGLLIAFARRARWVAAGAVIFAVALLPVLGLAAFDFQFFSTVADHYLYFAMLGLAAAAAFALAALSRRLPAAISATRALAAIILVALGVRSWFQAHYWHDTRSLFDHTLTVNPSSMAALNAMTLIALADHDPRTAEQFATRSLEVRPDSPDALVGLGSAYAMEGRSQDAMSSCAGTWDSSRRKRSSRASRWLASTWIPASLHASTTAPLR
jgi:hypothetical protein